MKKIVSLVFSAILFSCTFQSLAATYFVSPSGSDSNNGTQNSPFKTFDKAMQAISSGDTLFLRGGTYSNALKVTKSGTQSLPINIKAYQNEKPVINLNGSNNRPVYVTGNYVVLENIETTKTSGVCVYNEGDNVTIRGFTIHECGDHGLYTDGVNTLFEGNIVYRTVLINSAKNIPSGWGSGIKVRVGGDNSIIRNNTAYNNYGEGIAVTRGVNSQIIGNTIYDNYSVNLYIDNSIDVVAENNMIYCTSNSEFYRGTAPAKGISIGEEYYDGWGARLKNITIRNNIANGCNNGISSWASDVPNSGLDNVKILNNTFWNSKDTAISIGGDHTKTRNAEFKNNIVHQANGKLAVIEADNKISFSNNYWSPNLPDTWRNASGSNDKAGGVPFTQQPSINPTSYIPKEGSTIVNAGLPFTSFNTDFFSNQRTGNYDMGAVETGFIASEDPTPTPTIAPTSAPTPTVNTTPTTTPNSSPSTSICSRADINQDGIVNVFDFSILAQNFLKTNPAADINQDGIVNVFDFSILAQNFLKSCSASTATPTPTNTTNNTNIKAEFVLSDEWAEGYCGDFKVTNNTTTQILDYTLTFTLDDTMTSDYSGTFSKSGQTYTIKPLSWNKELAAGYTENDGPGFCAQKVGANNSPYNVNITY